MKQYVVSALALGALALGGCDKLNFSSEKPLFTQLDSTQTGIGFANKLVPNEKVNLIDYLYFYNGGGVAAGDVNGDGLADLYFVSNQGPNKLYLNKGGFKFEDVTEKAGVAGFADWQTGATFADVNGDGRLDIYVCAVGNFRGQEGSNELYINNGDGTFSERAADYGLDFTGFSTQAAFFDYDHDGDLDCYLLNHAVHTSRSYDRVSTRYLRQNEAGDYLYENQVISKNNRSAGAVTPAGEKPVSGKPAKFVDVSTKAGIYGAAMGYGLGITVADINNDGWEDLYVSNDFHEDDYYYVNNQNGTFTESIKKTFMHVSRFSMGNDVADVNNDGYADVLTLDMYPEDETVEKLSLGEDPLDIFLYKLAFGYMNQYSRNCLQLSQSGKKFVDVGPMAGVAATDWSWSPLLADFDNDGIKDIFIANGIVRRPNNLDYVKYASDDSLRYAPETTQTLDERAIKMMPEGKVHNYLYRGRTGPRYEDKSLAWGFKTPTYSNGAAYADLDNDGDLDLITNNIDDPAGIHQNQATTLFPNNQWLRVKLDGAGANRFGVGAKVVLKYRDSTGMALQVQQLMPTRGFESAVEPVLTFGVGERSVVDSLIVLWPSGQMEKRSAVKTGQTLTLRQNDARLDGRTYRFTAPSTAPLFTELDSTLVPYRHRENTNFYDFVRESLMPFQVSAEGPHLAVGDVNGDGFTDVYAGQAKWTPGQLLLQQSGGQFVNSPQPAFQRDSVFEDTDALFFDADRDNDLDLYVVSGGNEFDGKDPQQFDRLYLNDGKGNFQRNEAALPPMLATKSCVRPADVDADGDIDLFVGGRVVPFNYGKTPPSFLLINDGKGRFTDQTDKLAPALRNVGMVTNVAWTDVNGDKAPDLLVIGDWMQPRLFLNRRGKLVEKKDLFADDDVAMNGFWQGLTVADFDKDGDVDVVLGNLGLNNKFRKQPDGALKMWVGDLDKNQTTDQVLAYQRGSDWFPVAWKDELGKQMPSIINKRFTNYEDFAGKTIEDVFSDGELDAAEERIVNQFASVYLENRGGQFVVDELPYAAQVSKIFTLLPIDIDADGDLDVVGGGNFYNVSMYQGRYDASCGLVLRNDGGRFTVLSAVDTGFLLGGQVRDIKTLLTSRGLHLLAARNNLPVQIFRPGR